MSLLWLSSVEYLIPFWTNYPLKIMPSYMFITGTKLSIITFPIAFFPMKIIPFATSFDMNGVGNGNPLRYSCLESPTDRRPGQTIVHRVAKSWTWLSSWAVDMKVRSLAWRGFNDITQQVPSVQFSRSVVSDSLRPHGLQHARLPCPSPTPTACSNSCPSSRWSQLN